MAIAYDDKLGLAHAHIKGPDDDDGLDGLDDLIRGHTARIPEMKREVKVEHTSKTIAALEQFFKFLNEPNSPYDLKKLFDKLSTDALTPAEIGIVFQAMLYSTENEKSIADYYDSIAEYIGVFATKMIQTSYNAGYNDFELVTKDSPRIISKIGYFLNGTKERMVKFKVQDNVDHLCGYNSYCDVIIDADIPTDITGSWIDSHHCVFTFNKDISHKIGKLWVRGRFDFYAASSIYKTPKIDALKQLIYSVSHGAYNQIVFINPDGTEEAVLRHTHDPSTGVFVNRKYYELFRDVMDPCGALAKRSPPYKIIKVNKLEIIPISAL